MATNPLPMNPEHDPLMQPILWNGKEYRTSHYLHRDYRANSPHGGKYQRHDSFIRLLKGLEAIALYQEQGDFVMLIYDKTMFRRSTELVEHNNNKGLYDAFRAVSFKTLYLVNATIQVALSHHLDDEENKRLSVVANTATARQLSGKGTLPTELAERTIRAMLNIARLLGSPEHIALEEAIKQALLDTGVNLQPLLMAAPVMDDIPASETMLEPTDLAEELRLGTGQTGAIIMNRFLGQIGWQTRLRSGLPWTLTPAGEPQASRHAWMKNGKSGYNFKWNVEAVRNELKRRNMLPPDAAAD